MKIKLLFLGLLLWTLPGFSQNISFSVEEVRVLAKMSEDLRYTRAELEVADSIISHQRQMIELKNQEINLKTQEFQKSIKEATKKRKKIGFVSGASGILVGFLLGIFL